MTILFGNTHYNIGKNIIKNMSICLSQNEKISFLSGIVYADIGRFSFDKVTIHSDSKEFVKELIKYAKTDEELWFINGIKMHIIQDQESLNFLENIFESKCKNYQDYIAKCSFLEFYFKNKNKSFIYNKYLDKFNFNEVTNNVNTDILCSLFNLSKNKIENHITYIIKQYHNNINKDNLILYTDLIKSAYNSLNINLNNNAIYTQAGNIIGTFIISSAISEKKEITEKISQNILNECNKLTDKCLLIL